MYCVYTIQNKLSLKIYVGQSCDYKTRWDVHIKNAKDLLLKKIASNHKKIQYIHRAMAKHGIDNFEFQVIEEFETEEKADEAEKFWISFFNSNNSNFGYNLTPGGKKGVGCGPAHPLYGKPAANRLYTNEEEKVICERYSNEQIPITQLAEIYDCTESCIFNILNRHNTPILGNAVFSKGKHHSPETEFQEGQISPRRLELPEEEIIRQYLEDKLSTTEIAKKYDTHRTTIIRLLERNKIEMRNRGFYSKGKKAINRLFSDKKEQEICQEYQGSRISTIKLAKKYKCDRSTISEVLKRHKIKIRSGKLTDKEREEAYLSYLELGSARKVAEKYGVSKGTILSLAKSKSAHQLYSSLNLRQLKKEVYD